MRLENNNVALLWGGEANLSNSIIGNGSDNDVNLLMGNILLHPENATFSANFVVPGRMSKHKN